MKCEILRYAVQCALHIMKFYVYKPDILLYGDVSSGNRVLSAEYNLVRRIPLPPSLTPSISMPVQSKQSISAVPSTLCNSG